MARTRLAAGMEVSAGLARLALMDSTAGGPPTLLALAEVNADPLTVRETIVTAGGGQAEWYAAWAPGEGKALHHILAAPRLSDAEQTQYVHRVLKRDLGVNIDDLRLDMQELGPTEIEGRPATQMLAVGMDQAESRKMIDLVASISARSRLATTVALGLLRLGSYLCEGNAERAPMKIVAVAFLRHGVSTLVIAESGRLRFVREFDLSLISQSNQKTDAQAQLDPNTARALALDLYRAIQFFNQQHYPQTVEQVVLSGDATMVNGAQKPLQAQTECAVVTLEQALEGRLVKSGSVTGELSTYAVAMGLALGRRGATVPNLLPTNLRLSAERRQVVLGAAGAIVLALMTLFGVRFLQWRALSKQELRVASLQAELTELQPKVASRNTVRREAASVEHWRDLFGRLPGYQVQLAKLMTGIATAAPDSLTFQRFNIDRKGDIFIVYLEGNLRGPEQDPLTDDLRKFGLALQHIGGVSAVTPAATLSGTPTDGVVTLHYKVDLEFRDPWPFG